jgi:two-component system chemotaxis sensor kinase CheA
VESLPLPARLRTLFLTELDEHTEALNRTLVAAEQAGGHLPQETVQTLFRSAHSLKGAAAATAASEVEAICRRMEDLLERVRKAGTAIPPPVLEQLFADVDAIIAEGARLRRGPQTPAGAGPTTATGAPPQPDPAPSPRRASARPESSPSAAVQNATARTSVAMTEPATPEGTVLRVPVAKFDALLDQADMLIAATHHVEGLDARVQQLRAELEAGDAATTLADLARSAAGAERALRLARSHFADALRAARLLPFGQACEGLDRVVRDLARGMEKQAHVVVAGASTELDRAVLEAVRDPLLHLVRNAVSHGIESPADRQRADKPPTGSVRVEATLRGGSVQVTVSDDGAGVDTAAVAAAAERCDLPPPTSDAAALEALFLPGLSTVLEPNAVAGRGVGLDVVRSRVEALGGEVRAFSDAGLGTSVVLTLPLSVATVRVLLVVVAGETIALTTSRSARVVRVSVDEVRGMGGRRVLLQAGTAVPLVPLRTVLGFPSGEFESAEGVPAIIVGSDEDAVALAVDRLVREQEVVVKPLSDRLLGLPGALGAAVLADGQPVLVLNATACARLALTHAESPRRPDRSTPSARRLLLAEDSLTVRTLEQNILQTAGYEVMAAPDGKQAWALLQEHGADAVVADVDMPGMNGFELCRAIRASGRFSDIPVVLVTSLESDEDRRHGLAAGADAYLPKSTFDPTLLLESLERLL